jgi:hypothetical protein
VKLNRKAKFRLERMRVQEVSGVDHPANLQPFVVVKADAPPADPIAAPGAPPPAPAPAPMTLGQLGPLPSSVKQAVLDGAAGVIEKIQALAMAVGESPVDEAAQVPPELGAMFYDCAEDLEDLAAALGCPVDMAKPPIPPPHAPPAAGAPPAGAPPAAPSAPAPPHMPPARKSVEEIVAEEIGGVKSEIATLKGAFEDVAKAAAGAQASLKTSMDRLTLQLQQAATRTLKSLPVPNGQPPEPTPQTKSEHEWPEDLAESARLKKDARPASRS